MLAGANADRTDAAALGTPGLRSCGLSEESGSAFSRRQPTQRNRFAERGVAVTADEAYFVVILPDEVDASGTIVAVEAGCESEPPRGRSVLDTDRTQALHHLRGGRGPGPRKRPRQGPGGREGHPHVPPRPRP